MQATTIKLDARVHAAARRMKACDETLTAFVRNLVNTESRRRALEHAAEAYEALLAGNETEAQDMAEWAGASLTQSLVKRLKK